MKNWMSNITLYVLFLPEYCNNVILVEISLQRVLQSNVISITYLQKN